MILHQKKSLIGRELVASKKEIFLKKKVYNIHDYERLIAPFIHYRSMRHCDFVKEVESLEGKYLLIRHDIDHDPYTALKIAKWEYKNSIQTTYCLLHSAWYYGHLDPEHNSYLHSKELTNWGKTFVDLGHEVNLHNNLIIVGLKQNIDPAKLLMHELDFFRSEGIQIKGTSTHGDRLCRELNFRNWEFFKECCDHTFGGPRKISYHGKIYNNNLYLGQYSMFDFGLTYEAYDIFRPLNITDSGGKLHTKEIVGRGHLEKKRKKSCEVVGILTHPIWWEF